MNSIRTIATLTILCTAVVLSACEKTEIDTPAVQTETARPAKIVPVLSDGISVLRTFPGMLEAKETTASGLSLFMNGPKVWP